MEVLHCAVATAAAASSLSSSRLSLQSADWSAAGRTWALAGRVACGQGLGRKGGGFRRRLLYVRSGGGGDGEGEEEEERKQEDRVEVEVSPAVMKQLEAGKKKELNVMELFEQVVKAGADKQKGGGGGRRWVELDRAEHEEAARQVWTRGEAGRGAALVRLGCAEQRHSVQRRVLRASGGARRGDAGDQHAGRLLPRVHNSLHGHAVYLGLRIRLCTMCQSCVEAMPKRDKQQRGGNDKPSYQKWKSLVAFELYGFDFIWKDKKFLLHKGSNYGGEVGGWWRSWIAERVEKLEWTVKKKITQSKQPLGFSGRFGSHAIVSTCRL